MEKKFEELKGMTQEDLVRLVLELQEKLKESENRFLLWYNKHEALDARCKCIKHMLNGINDLVSL